MIEVTCCKFYPEQKGRSPQRGRVKIISKIVRENSTMWVVITEFEEHFQDQGEGSADTYRNLILSSFNATRKPMERGIFSDLLSL